MMQIALIGVAAGVASALLFASVASGSLLSIPLFYLAPLPILIAAVGWSHWAGLVAAVAAAISLAAALGGFFFLAFLVGVGLPAWWLGYLALLARPAARSGPDGLEWYPVGRIVLWAAILAALVVVIAMANIGPDAESIRSSLRGAFERILRAQTQTPRETPLQVPGLPDPKPLIEFLVAVVPPTADVLAVLTNMLALWLAARVVKISGRLRRPWPDLAAMTFPSFALTLLAAAAAASFLGGIFGIAAGVLTASLLMAYALLGLAVLHALTRRVNGRAAFLGGTYALIIVFGWPILLLALLGVTDAAFDLRGRLAARRGPPPSLPT